MSVLHALVAWLIRATNYRDERALPEFSLDEDLARSLPAPAPALSAYRTAADPSGAEPPRDTFQADLERLVRLVKALPENGKSGAFLSLSVDGNGKFHLEAITTGKDKVVATDLAFGVMELLEVFDQEAKRRLAAAEKEAADAKNRADTALERRRRELRGL
jgi:hypothetical protein